MEGFRFEYGGFKNWCLDLGFCSEEAISDVADGQDGFGS